MNYAELWDELSKGITHFTAGNVVMMAVGGILIALAVLKEYEPEPRSAQLPESALAAECFLPLS